MQKPVNLREYAGQPVLVTFRDGLKGSGVVTCNNSSHFPFRFSSVERDFVYTEYGQLLPFAYKDVDIVSIEPLESEMKVGETVNLQHFMFQSVRVTYRDGEQGFGLICPSVSSNYPFRFVSKTALAERSGSYTKEGKALMFNESDEDIVSISSTEMRDKPDEKMTDSLTLSEYLDRRVRVTYRDGTKEDGSILSDDSCEIYPFIFTPYGNEGGETYTELGQVVRDKYNDSDIVSIELLESEPAGEGSKDSAVEKMALALLPAVFTSLESDPNLEYAIETAIRGTFLAMFGDDLSGDTLNHSVSVIKSRISLAVKQ